MRAIVTSGAFLLAVLSAVLFGTVSNAKVDCEKAETQMDMNECTHEYYQKQDKELNAAYRQLTILVEKNADKKTKQLLVKAQKAWIAFRDSECEFVSSINEGGTMYSMVYDGCQADLTTKRTQELKADMEIYK